MLFGEMRAHLIAKLVEELHEKDAIKWYAVLKVDLIRVSSDGEEDVISPFFRSKCAVELLSHTIEQHIDEAWSKIEASFEEFVQRGSGWRMNSINFLEPFIAKYQPLAGSSYIPTPSKLAAKKAVLNIQNNDSKCLVWCLLAHQMNLDRNSHPERVQNYILHESTIQLGSVQCPVPPKKMATIEKLNNICVNVYGYEDGEVCPIFISKREDRDCVNLLLIANEERQHYTLIRSMSRLL